MVEVWIDGKLIAGVEKVEIITAPPGPPHVLARSAFPLVTDPLVMDLPNVSLGLWTISKAAEFFGLGTDEFLAFLDANNEWTERIDGQRKVRMKALIQASMGAMVQRHAERESMDNI